MQGLHLSEDERCIRHVFLVLYSRCSASIWLELDGRARSGSALSLLCAVFHHQSTRKVKGVGGKGEAYHRQLPSLSPPLLSYPLTSDSQVRGGGKFIREIFIQRARRQISIRSCCAMLFFPPPSSPFPFPFLHALFEQSELKEGSSNKIVTTSKRALIFFPPSPLPFFLVFF